MMKVIKKAYIGLVALFAVLLLYYSFFFQIRQEGQSELQGYTIMEPIELSQADYEYKDGIVLHLNGISGNKCRLLFYSIHSTVEIYHGAECIYSMKPARKNAFSKTPGCIWNDVVLTEELNGKDICILIKPVYSGIVYGTPDFYFGDKASISVAIYQRDMLQIFLCLCLFVIGAFFIGFVWMNLKNSEVDKNLAMLGIFALQMGIWKLSDSAAVKWMFNGFSVFSLVPFMGLAMVGIPWVLFFQDLHSTKEQKIWFIPSWVGLAVTAAVLLLQYADLADLRQTFPLILFSIFFGIVIVLYMMVHEYRTGGWNYKLRRNIVGFAITVTGVILDFGTYRLAQGRRTSSFALMAFLIYTVVLGVRVLKESKALIDVGTSAQDYEDMAFHDKLTGLYNRGAFIADTDPYNVEPEDCIVVVLDLNNLKVCNDTLGHERGDVYIKESAAIVQNTFGQIGKCYRMGGDEFYCLIKEGGMTACKEKKALMDEMIAAYNEQSEDICMGIACGYARFDRRLDYDLSATAKRADKLMYKNKENMKKHA